MIFVIVRSCIRKITLVRVSTLVTGNPKILMINVYASYVYPCQPPPPRCSVKPLHLGSNVRDPYPTGPSQVATLPHLKQKTKMYRLAIPCRASSSAPPTPYLSAPQRKITFLLLTRQATAVTAIMTPIITIAAIHKLAQSPGLWRWT